MVGGAGNSTLAAIDVICVLAAPGVGLLAGSVYFNVPSSVLALVSPATVRAGSCFFWLAETDGRSCRALGLRALTSGVPSPRGKSSTGIGVVGAESRA